MIGIRDIIIKFIISYYKKNKFYPSYDEIAKGIGRTKSTIYTHMKKLEAKGIIVRKFDYSSQYRLINMDFICRHGVMESCSTNRRVSENENCNKYQ